MLAAVPASRYAEDYSGREWDELGIASEAETPASGPELQPLGGTLAGSAFRQPEAVPDRPDTDSTTGESRGDDNRETEGVAGISVIRPEEVARLAAGPRRVDPRVEPLVGSLLEALDELSWDCRTGDWARDTAAALRRLAMATAEAGPATDHWLDELERRVRSGEDLAASLGDDPAGARVAAAGRMVGRRLELWKLVRAATLAGPVALEKADRAALGRRVAVLAARTRDSEEGARWQEFLGLDHLAVLAAGEATTWTATERLVARLLLARLDTARWSPAQQRFVAGEPVAGLRSELEAIAAEPIDAEGVLEAIEKYDRTGSPVAAGVIGSERLKLTYAGQPACRRLSERLAATYGNPNVRIAVTAYLLNRLIPDRQPQYQWVRDTVLGKPVRGESRTDAEVSLELVPDPRRLRMALKIDGTVSARTYTTSGPATLFNDSASTYSAVKRVELATDGLHLAPAEVTAENRTRLRGVRTLFDPIPLLGSLMQEAARSEHERSRPEIRREVKEKIYHQAKQQVDAEVDARLGELGERLKGRLLDPLAKMSVGPTLVESKTTQKRMVMQLRVASVLQLGADTPRPWAPADSVLSCQVHQSALNNVLQRLELDGATLSIAQLRQRIAERFDRPEMLQRTTENDDARITFAPRDAVRVELRDGRFTIGLAVRELRKGSRHWRNFEVLVSYRPRITGRTAELARDGVVRLSGRLKAGSQIALRGIFSKTFPKDRTWPVVPPQLAEDPRLAGLAVTQLEVRDGWIALALGPQRPRPAVAARPRTAVD